MKQKLEKDDKENKDTFNKLNDEITQYKVSLANISFENEEKMNELKVKIRKLTTKLESMGVKSKK